MRKIFRIYFPVPCSINKISHNHLVLLNCLIFRSSTSFVIRQLSTIYRASISIATLDSKKLMLNLSSNNEQKDDSSSKDFCSRVRSMHLHFYLFVNTSTMDYVIVSRNLIGADYKLTLNSSVRTLTLTLVVVQIRWQ